MTAFEKLSKSGQRKCPIVIEDDTFVFCRLCWKKVKNVNTIHLRSCSGISVQEYRILFPNVPLRAREFGKNMEGDKNPSKRPEVIAKIVDKNTGKTSENCPGIARRSKILSELYTGRNKKDFPHISRQAEAVSALWKDPDSVYNSDEYRKTLGKAGVGKTKKNCEWRKRSAKKVKKVMKGRNTNYEHWIDLGFSHEEALKKSKAGRRKGAETTAAKFTCGAGKSGYRSDLGHSVRSTWEANACRVFNLLGMRYEYESEKCRFDLGDRVYIADFYFPDSDRYLEVKGWVDPTFILKWADFKEKYPQVDLKVADLDWYTQLKQSYSDMIPVWEEDRVSMRNPKGGEEWL